MKNPANALCHCAGVLLMVCPVFVHAATWNGGSGDYGEAANWTPQEVPCLEIVLTNVSADIPTGGNVAQDVPVCTVDTLTLGAAVTLTLAASTQYNAGSSDIAGRIVGLGGGISAAGSIFSGVDARLNASLGSQMNFDAGSWNATGSQNSSITRLSALNPGSAVNLASLSDLNAGFNSSSGGAQEHLVLAQDGGSVDISGLVSVAGPIDAEDRLKFLLDGATSSMALTSLSVVGTHVVFQATNGGSHSLPALSDAGARFVADTGSQILANSSTWTLSDLGVPNSSLDILRAIDPGSLLDLSGMMSLNGAFNSGSLGAQQHTVLADGGGIVDLSGLVSVTGPVDEEDRLNFLVNDAASAIELDSLGDVGTHVLFSALNGGAHDLPALDDVAARFVAESGAQIVASASSWSLSDLGLRNSSLDILRAINPGSLLDLSGMTSLDGAFNSNSLGIQEHTVLADDGGIVDLSGLVSATGPLDEEDRLTFLINDSTATMRLDSLSSIGSRVLMSAQNGGSHELPALGVAGARFVAEAGGRITARASAWSLTDLGLPNSSLDILRAANGALLDLHGMVSLDAGFNSNSLGSQQHTVLADAGGTVDLSSLVSATGPVDEEDRLNFLVNDSSATMSLESLSDVGSRVVLWAQNGGMLYLPSLGDVAGQFVAESGGQIVADAGPWTLSDLGLANSTVDIVGARNAGALVDLSAMTSLNAGFNSNSLAAQIHTVRADDGAIVDLAGLDSITGPLDAEDELAFVAGDGGTLILGPLASVTDGRKVSLTIEPADAQVTFPRALDADSSIAVLALADSRVSVTGSLSFAHVDESRFNLEAARVSVEDADPVTVEIGGNNNGATLQPEPNFGFAQLIVGSPAQTTSARLVDVVDNGNGNDLCSMGRESLYLYGFDAGPDADGLRILNGSTLELGGLDLYAAIGGVLMHINPLLTPGVPLPYDEGQILLGTPFDVDLDGVTDSVDNCVLEANPDQTDSDGDGYGNACDGDLNGDLFVNGLDLGQFKLAFFTACGGQDFNPDADFNDDCQVNAQDLGILKLLFFAPPGPSCPMP